MKSTFGQSVSLTLFGESHGECIGAVLDGIAPGIEVDDKNIKSMLSKRRPSEITDTKRVENDNFKIVSGLFEGKTTGTPLCIIIPNENTKSSDYNYGIARPSHADYSAYCKYHGFEDYRGGGHFSGRITAPIVAVGGILLPALEKKGIFIGSHILKCRDASDREFENVKNDITALKNADFPCLNTDFKNSVNDIILKAKADNDSVGGIIQTAVYGIEAGIGEPWFDSVEGLISHAVFSIGAVKGIEFGKGFSVTGLTGKDANDEFMINEGKIVTATNNNGGINGGITNGMPIVFQTAVKPTPSIAKKQNTVDFINMKETEIEVGGRHDPAIIRRICPVIDSVTALVLCDLLCQRYGTDYLAEE